jgi:hypothetical protein
MLMNPAGLRSEKGCAGDDQQKLKLQTQLLIRAGAPHQQTRNCLKIIREIKEKIGRGVPDGCLTPRQNSRLTVGLDITLT